MSLYRHITNHRFWRLHGLQIMPVLFLLLWTSQSAAQPSPDYPFLIFTPGPQALDPADTQTALPESLTSPDSTTSEDSSTQGPLIGDVQARLKQLETDARPFEDDPERLDTILTLGRLLQEQDQHEEAISHFEEARQMVRINDGLFSERQLPMVDAIVDSHLALGDYEQADDAQASRLHLIRQNHPEDSDVRRTAEDRWAQWNVTYFLNHYLYRASPSTFSITRQHSGSRIHRPSVFRSAQISPFEFDTMRRSGPLRNGHHLSRQTPRLNAAEDEFREHFSSGNPQQRLDALKSLLAIAYYRNLEVAYRLRYQDLFREIQPVTFGDAQNIARDSYADGLERINELLRELPTADPLRNELLLIRADWHLVFGYRGRADDDYSGLEARLSRELDGEEISAFFNPAPLVMLPTFVTHQFSPQPWSRLHATEGKGYLDARLDIHLDGSIRQVSITDASPETPDRLRILLRDYLDSLVVRPPIINGRLTRSRDLPVRFHYRY